MSRFYGSLCIRLRHLRPFSSATQNIRNVTSLSTGVFD